MEFIVRNGLNVRLNIVGDVEQYLKEGKSANKVKVVGRLGEGVTNMKSVSTKGQGKTPVKISGVSKKSRRDRRLENRINVKVVAAKIKEITSLDKKMLDLSVMEESYKKGVERLKEKQSLLLSAGDLEGVASVKKMEEDLKKMHEQLSSGYSQCIPSVDSWSDADMGSNVVDVLQELDVNKGDKKN